MAACIICSREDLQCSRYNTWGTKASALLEYTREAPWEHSGLPVSSSVSRKVSMLPGAGGALQHHIMQRPTQSSNQCKCPAQTGSVLPGTGEAL